MKNAYFGLLEETEDVRSFLTSFVSEIIEECIDDMIMVVFSYKFCVKVAQVPAISMNGGSCSPSLHFSVLLGKPLILWKMG